MGAVFGVKILTFAYRLTRLPVVHPKILFLKDALVIYIPHVYLVKRPSIANGAEKVIVKIKEIFYVKKPQVASYIVNRFRIARIAPQILVVDGAKGQKVGIAPLLWSHPIVTALCLIVNLKPRWKGRGCKGDTLSFWD